jgi:hypothetical protein
MEVSRIDPERLVFVDEMGTHTSLAPLYASYAPVGERVFFEIPNRDPEKPRQEHDASYEPSSRRDGTFHGRGRGDHSSGLRDLR